MFIRKKKGKGIMDSLISAMFSETGKKLATSAAEAAIKSAASKGAEKLVNHISKSKPITKVEQFSKPKSNRVIENIFEGTSIKFIK